MSAVALPAKYMPTGAAVAAPTTSLDRDQAVA